MPIVSGTGCALASLLAMAALACSPAWSASPPGSAPAIRPACDDEPGRILSTLRPDYRDFIGRLRPFDPAVLRGNGPRPGIYMALVRPGARDPRRPESAPFIGSGIRNDVLYDVESIAGRRSSAWALMLLDHEYFHARHLAGATSLPLPGKVSPGVERHFYEAAAWGFSVSQARAGRYAGLRPDEFREALDHYGEHYAALRDLIGKTAPDTWRTFSDLLRQPAALVMTRGSRPSEGPARPSGWDRSTATP